MTTNDLTERIARAAMVPLECDQQSDLDECPRCGEHVVICRHAPYLSCGTHDTHAGLGEPCPEAAKIAAVVMSVVAPAIRAAKAEALREAVRDMGEWADEGLIVTGDEHNESTWLEWTTGEWLERRADRIETGDGDERR